MNNNLNEHESDSDNISSDSEIIHETMQTRILNTFSNIFNNPFSYDVDNNFYESLEDIENESNQTENITPNINRFTEVALDAEFEEDSLMSTEEDSSTPDNTPATPRTEVPTIETMESISNSLREAREMLQQVSSTTNSNQPSIPPLSWSNSPFSNFDLETPIIRSRARRDAIFIPSRFNLNNENTNRENVIQEFNDLNLIPCEFCNNLVPANEYRQHTSICYGTNFIEELVETVIETTNVFSESNNETSSNLTSVNFSVQTRPRPTYRRRYARRGLALFDPENLDSYENNLLLDEFNRETPGLINKHLYYNEIYDVSEHIMCSICRHTLEELIDEKIVKTICGHIYCEKCINKWFENSKKCPMCMVDLEDLYKDKNK